MSSKYRLRSGDQVDDAEREDLAERLAKEYTDGRISQDDYLRLLDIVYQAATLGELVEVVEILPPRQTHQVPAIAVQGSQPPGTLSEPRGMGVATMVVVGGGAVLILVVLLVLLGVILL